jgi:hypothetical protein
MKKLSAAVVLVFSLMTFSFASDNLLEAVGAASGSNLYLTYTSIGAVADAYKSKVYEADMTNQVISSIIAQAKVVKTHLQKLIDNNELSESDTAFVKEINAAYDLLVAEGDSMLKYIKSKKESDLKAYDKNRTDAWAKIAKLLNLK